MKKLVMCSEESEDKDIQLKESLSNLKDDFDYIIAGIERAGRYDKYSEVMFIISDIEESFDAAITNLFDLQEV